MTKGSWSISGCVSLMKNESVSKLKSVICDACLFETVARNHE